jgi:hypothetical protein
LYKAATAAQGAAHPEKKTPVSRRRPALLGRHDFIETQGGLRIE